jgi:HK97 family phage major capsid protein
MTTRNPQQTRSVNFSAAGFEADGRIPVVISTDAVVDVADGPEILVHTPDAVDMSRAPIPIITTHRGGQMNVGVVEDIQIIGGQARGMARFGQRREAVEIAADVANKILRSVSVGYSRIKGHIRKDGVLVITRWMPSHAAIVAEPADVGAGFYRSADETAPQFELTEAPDDAAPDAVPPVADAPQVHIRTITPAIPAITTTTKEAIMAEVIETPAGQNAGNTDTASMERLRIRSITDLGRQHKIADDQVRAMIDDEHCTADEAARRVLDVLTARSGNARQVAPAEIGMTRKEVEKFSMLNAVRAVINKDWSKAGLELEAHTEIQRRLGGNPLNEHTFYVPLEVQSRQMAKRDMTSAGASGSNYLVGTDNMSFIELLRNRSVAVRMGARMMSGMIGNVTIPRQTAAAAAGWLSSESTAITEGQPTIGQLSLSPKHVGAYTEISRLLALQSSPDAESLVMSDLAQSVGLAVDLAALAGAGTGGQPTGITATSGVGSVTGTSLAFAGMLEFQTDIGNALAPSCGYVTTAAVAALLATRVKFASTASPLWDGSLLDADVCGFRGMSSAQMAAASMIFGDFAQLVIAEWGSLAIEVNPYANFQAGIIGVRALYAVDVGVRVPGAFSVATTIT